GSLSAVGRESEIRANIIKDDLVEAVISMPDRLFYSTGIPVSLWFINKNKTQKGKTLFIDARSLCEMVTRAHRKLIVEDIYKNANAYRYFVKGEHIKKLGYFHVANLDEIEQNNYVLTPVRYVGMEEIEVDGIPFEEKMVCLTAELGELFNKSHKLEEVIREQLGGIGFDV